MSQSPTSPNGVAAGLDLVEIDRVRGMLRRWGDRFLQRCFTPGELKQSRNRTASLAARLAAKEAFAKAVASRPLGFGWRDVEVVTAADGHPELKLHRGAAETASRLGFKAVSLSLTHTRTAAAAVVVAVTGKGTWS